MVRAARHDVALRPQLCGHGALGAHVALVAHVALGMWRWACGAGLLRTFWTRVATAQPYSTTHHYLPGARCVNNPFLAAYNCGACCGREGGPNARVFARYANDPEVRRLLAEDGVTIDDDTWFVGGYHDTTSDLVELYDTDSVPASHQVWTLTLTLSLTLTLTLILAPSLTLTPTLTLAPDPLPSARLQACLAHLLTY